MTERAPKRKEKVVEIPRKVCDTNMNLENDAINLSSTPTALPPTTTPWPTASFLTTQSTPPIIYTNIIKKDSKFYGNCVSHGANDWKCAHCEQAFINIKKNGMSGVKRHFDNNHKEITFKKQPKEFDQPSIKSIFKPLIQLEMLFRKLTKTVYDKYKKFLYVLHLNTLWYNFGKPRQRIIMKKESNKNGSSSGNSDEETTTTKASRWTSKKVTMKPKGK
uniref:BED-type domain-containing protein n=1 Tax=Rhabditophanes sp. KR3021 TaxID=114890 RepID=A0AC35TVX8_9BILA